MTDNHAYPPYPPPHTTPPAPSTNRHWPWIIGAVAAAIVLTIGIVAALILVGGDDEEIATVIVTYELTGPPVEVEVTYWGSLGARSEPEIVTLPWQVEVAKGGDNTFLSVSAHRNDSASGSLACRITTDDTTIVENQSRSRFVFCHGDLDDAN